MLSLKLKAFPSELPNAMLLIEIARKILKSKHAHKIILPADFAVAESFSPRAKVNIVDYNQIQPNQVGLDLGLKTINLFRQYLSSAKTVV